MQGTTKSVVCLALFAIIVHWLCELIPPQHELFKRWSLLSAQFVYFMLVAAPLAVRILWRQLQSVDIFTQLFVITLAMLLGARLTVSFVLIVAISLIILR